MPDMHTPEMPSVPAYKEAGPWIQAAPADDRFGGGVWWSMYQSKDLFTLESKVASGNQNLQAALARLEEARADAEVAGAGLFPTLTLNADPNRYSASRTIASPRAHPLYNDALLAGDLSYETDIWGSRAQTQSRRASAAREASADDVAVAELDIRAELARDYFTLKGYDEIQRLLDQTVDAYTKAYDLTRRRHKGGIATTSDETQAETQLDSAKTAAADNHMKRAQMEHAIAVLTGDMPSALQPAHDAGARDRPCRSSIPAFPASLLQRRPDIAAAERRVAAANAGHRRRPCGVLSGHYPDRRAGL